MSASRHGTLRAVFFGLLLSFICTSAVPAFALRQETPAQNKTGLEELKKELGAVPRTAGLEEVSARISGTRQVTVSAGQKTAAFSFDAEVLKPLLLSPDQQTLIVRTRNNNLYAHDLSKLSADGTAPRIWNHSVSKGDVVRFSDDGSQVLLEHPPATKRRLSTTLALDARTGKDMEVLPISVEPNEKITPQQVHVMVLAESVSNRRDALDVVRGELSPQGVNRDQSVGLTDLAMLRRHLGVLKEKNITPTLVLVGNNNNFEEEARAIVHRRFNPSIPVLAFSEGGPEKLKQPIENHVLSRLIPSGQPAAGVEEAPVINRLMDVDAIVRLVTNARQPGSGYTRVWVHLFGEPDNEALQDPGALRTAIQAEADQAGLSTIPVSVMPQDTRGTEVRIFIGPQGSAEFVLRHTWEGGDMGQVMFEVPVVASYLKALADTRPLEKIHLGEIVLDWNSIESPARSSTLRFAVTKAVRANNSDRVMVTIHGKEFWIGIQNDPRLSDLVQTELPAAEAARRIPQRGITDWWTSGEQVSKIYGTADPSGDWSQAQWIQRILLQPFGMRVKLAYSEEGQFKLLRMGDDPPPGFKTVKVTVGKASDYLENPPDGFPPVKQLQNQAGNVVLDFAKPPTSLGVQKAVYQAMDRWPVRVTLLENTAYAGDDAYGAARVHQILQTATAATQILDAKVRWLHVDSFGIVDREDGAEFPFNRSNLEGLLKWNAQGGKVVLTVRGDEAWVSSPAAGLEEKGNDQPSWKEVVWAFLQIYGAFREQHPEIPSTALPMSLDHLDTLLNPGTGEPNPASIDVQLRAIGTLLLKPEFSTKIKTPVVDEVSLQDALTEAQDAVTALFKSSPNVPPPGASRVGLEEAVNVSFAEVLSAVRGALSVPPRLDSIRIVGNKPGEEGEVLIQQYDSSAEGLVQMVERDLRERFGDAAPSALYSIRIDGRQMVIAQPVHVVFSNGRTKLAAGVNDAGGLIGDPDNQPEVLSWEKMSHGELPEGALHDVQDGMFVILGGGVGSGELENGQPIYSIPGVTDVLNEIGWHLVTTDGGTTWVWRGEGAKPGALEELIPQPASGPQEWSLEQHMGGRFLAARAAAWMRQNGREDVDTFGEVIGIETDDLLNGLSRNHRPIVPDENQQQRVLQTMTNLGQQGDSIANQFIEESGRALGTALRAFRERFKEDHAFARGRVAIGSTVGEKFGVGADDRFLNAVRKAVGTEDVVRSAKTDVKREQAFSMPTRMATAGPEETLSAFVATTVSTEIRTPTGLIFVNPQGLAVGATLKYASDPSGNPLFRRYVADNDHQVQVLNELGIPKSEIVFSLRQAKLDIRNQNLNPHLIGDVMGVSLTLLQEIQKVAILLTPQNYDQQQAEKAAQEVLKLFL